MSMNGNNRRGRVVEEWRCAIRDRLLKGRKYRDIDYSATKLAEELGVRPCVLSAMLRESFGMRYADLVNSHRVEDAKKLLKNKRKAGYTVDEIGLMVGFANRQSFFTAFMKFAGTTPQAYRMSDVNINS